MEDAEPVHVRWWPVAAGRGDLLDLPGLLDLLDGAERERHARFREPADAAAFLARRAGLRLALSEHLEVAPDRLQLGTSTCPRCGSPTGRPVLRSPRGGEVSVASTRDLVVLAIADRPVGVDVEGVRAPALGDARAVLHPADRAAIEALPRSARPRATARCWVRTEALLKCRGTGIAHGLGETAVGAGARPLDVPDHVLADVAVPGPLVAAVAVRGLQPIRLVVRRSRFSTDGPSARRAGVR